MKIQTAFLLFGLLISQQLFGLEIDPTTRQHSANDPNDWSGAITVSPAVGEENWTAEVTPEFVGDDVSWVSITPVPPTFLVYAMNENFAAEVRTALIDFGAGVKFKLVQSGRGALLSANSFTTGSTGGTNTLSLTVLAGTTWRAASTVPWIRILSGPTGFGSGTVRFAVDPYGEVLPRGGTLVVAGQVVSVSQTGIDLTIEPTQAVVSDALSIVSFNVTALQSQAWTPVPDVSWVSVLSPGPKQGNGTVTMSVLPNGSYLPRQGHVNVGSKTFLVNQAGNQNPTLSISPLNSTSPREGASGGINVLVSPETPWSATSSAAWLQVVGAAEGTNNGTAAFVVSPNNTLTSREGVIEVAAADPLPAPNLRRGLSQHLVFESADPGDNLITAQGDRGDLVAFVRAVGRNGGQALRFGDATAWNAGMTSEKTVSFWFAVDFATRLGTVATVAGHSIGITADAKVTIDGVATTVPVVSEAWYQVIARRSGTQADIFLDGTLLTSVNDASEGLTFNPTGGFLGKLDDYRNYDRVLEDTEVYSLHNDEAAGNGLAIYGPSPSATQGGLPLVGKLRPDVNTIDAVSGRQWARSAVAGEFIVVPGNFTWPEAYSDAISRGGVLAWWDTVEQHSTIRDEVIDRDVWVNLTKISGNGWNRKTPDGESPFPGPIPWAAGEPGTIVGEDYGCYIFGRSGYVDVANNFRAAYLMRPYPANYLSSDVTLDTTGLQFVGGASGVVRFSGVASLIEWGALSLRSNTNLLSLSVDGGATFFDWPLPFSLEDRTHVATLVLANNVEAAVYLDGNFLFSRPTTAAIVTGSSGTLEAWLAEDGEIRVYGRPLTGPEALAVNNEMAPDVQYFTLVQEPAVPALTETSATVLAAGATVQTDLQVPSGVPWTASSSLSWLQFVKQDASLGSELSATGPATISVFVEANNSTEGRQGVVTIAGLEFEITQLGRTVTLNPLSAGMTTYGGNVSAVIGVAGGALLLGVLPEAGTSWTIDYANAADSSWITPNPASATGNKDVLFAVSPYNSPLAARTAVFYIADKEFRVTQRGYSATVTPNANDFPAGGGDGTLSVTVPTSAFWETVSLSPWITIITGQNANGSGTVTYKVASNTGPDRFGTIIVAGETIQVTQAEAVVVTEPLSLGLSGTTLRVYGQQGVTFPVERSTDLNIWEPFTQVVGQGPSVPAEVTIQIEPGASKFFRATAGQ